MTDAIANSSDPLSRIVQDQAKGKPEPAPNIAELIRAEVSPPEPEDFNPAIHETDPVTGGPVLKKDGTLKRKRGRRQGQSNGPGAIDQAEGAGGVPEPAGPPISPAQAAAEAKLCASMVFGGAVSLLGEQWEPEPEERDQITDALREYIATTGGLGLPPWATVAIAFGAYAARRTPVGRLVGMAAPPEPEPTPEPAPGAADFAPAAAAVYAAAAPVQGKGMGSSPKPPVG